MINPPRFNSLDEMNSSEWMQTVKQKFESDVWPPECNRCKDTEQVNNTSIRLNALAFDKTQTQNDYLIVGGVLDNLCNSACQTCNEHLSTKIGGLKGQVIRINNINKFWELPQERIVHLDINGGEPSYSPYYKEILANPPPNVKSIRLNTNCSTVLEELLPLVQRGIKVTVTVSFDGVGSVHNYIRWPITWEAFIQNLMTYKTMPVDLNLWTTVSALNIGDFKNILSFVKENNFNHSWALLESPAMLSIKYKNYLTLNSDVPDQLRSTVGILDDNSDELTKFILLQDRLRNINMKDFLK
jgi:sulfatase maturation enzyme AslB (radical SAM superfamily)